MKLASYRPLRVKGAVFLCMVAAMIATSCAAPPRGDLDLESEVLSLAVNTKKIPASIEEKHGADTIGEYYRNTLTKRNVINFFASLTKSETVAVAILDNASRHSVPAGLAFAIAYEESRFNPNALNRNKTSVDRGLFQLNSTSFPDISDLEAFNPSRNATEGLKYFKHILDLSGNEVSALAMYNAGRTRVSREGAPVTTLDYISRILNYEKNINSLFTAKVVARSSTLSRIRLGLLSGQGVESRE